MTRAASRSIAIGASLLFGSLLVQATAKPSSPRAATPGVARISTTITTPAGRRPLHMITVTPGMGAHLEAIWLGGGPGRTGTVGGFIPAMHGHAARSRA